MAVCAAPIKGRVLRLVAVDTCGVPITGDGGLTVVSSGFVSVAQEPEYEDGEEFFERNANGDACVNEKDDPTLKRMVLTTDWCEVDPVLSAYAMSARLLDTESMSVTGTGFAVAEGSPRNRFSLEVWQRVAGSGACDPSGNQLFIYNAWPNTGSVQVGSYTIENGRSTLQFIGETRGASPLWGDGPGETSWLPDGETVVAGEHWLWNITPVPPPEAVCGPTELI